MSKRLLVSCATLALALGSVACGGDDHAANSNTVAAANKGNSNVAVVVNSNNSALVNSNSSTTKELTRADFDKDKAKYESEAKSAGRKIGTGANDLWLWTKTRSALLAADDLRDSTINVDVENDMIMLTGTVGSAEQKAKAETVAKGIEGNKGVKNELKVTAVATDNKNAVNANTKK